MKTTLSVALRLMAQKWQSEADQVQPVDRRDGHARADAKRCCAVELLALVEVAEAEKNV